MITSVFQLIITTLLLQNHFIIELIVATNDEVHQKDTKKGMQEKLLRGKWKHQHTLLMVLDGAPKSYSGWRF